jgi:hypothetical protein
MRAVLLFSALFTMATAACSQHSSDVKQVARETQGSPKTIEGFWQDTARRILYARDAPASYVYGQWATLDQTQTYPTAKHILRSGTTYQLVDLLYDDESAIEILSANENGIKFVRSTSHPPCKMYHACRLEREELLCSLENICREAGKDVVDWKGEERYARRVNCERGPRREAQGIPHRCY